MSFICAVVLVTLSSGEDSSSSLQTPLLILLGTTAGIPLLLAVIIDCNKFANQALVIIIGISGMLLRYVLILEKVGTLSGTDVLGEWGLAQLTQDTGDWYPEIGIGFTNTSGFPGVIFHLIATSEIANLSLTHYPTVQIMISSTAVLVAIFLLVRELTGPRLASIAFVVASLDSVLFFSAPGLIRESLAISAFLLTLFILARAVMRPRIMGTRYVIIVLLTSMLIVITHDFSTVIFLFLIVELYIGILLAFSFGEDRARRRIEIRFRKLLERRSRFAGRFFFAQVILLILFFIWIGYISEFALGMWVDRIQSVFYSDRALPGTWGSANRQILYSGSEAFTIGLRVAYRLLILLGFIFIITRRFIPSSFSPKNPAFVNVYAFWGGLAILSVIALSLLPLGPHYSFTRLIKFELMFYSLFVGFVVYVFADACMKTRRQGNLLRYGTYLCTIAVLATVIIPPADSTLESMHVGVDGIVDIEVTPASYTPRDIEFVKAVNSMIAPSYTDVYFEREAGAMFFFLLGHSSWLYSELDNDFFKSTLPVLMDENEHALLVFRQDALESQKYVDSSLVVQDLSDTEMSLLIRCSIVATDGSSEILMT